MFIIIIIILDIKLPSIRHLDIITLNWLQGLLRVGWD